MLVTQLLPADVVATSATSRQINGSPAPVVCTARRFAFLNAEINHEVVVK